VVVEAEGIGRNLRLAIGDMLRRSVVEGHGDNGLQPRHEQAWVQTLVEVVGHIRHIGVATLGQPLPQPRLHGGADVSGAGKATSRKAETRRLGSNKFFIQTF
jgi:hypothetical protein